MFLPKPVLSDDGFVMAVNSSHQSASLIWNAWSDDPIKAAVIRAILSCMSSASNFDFYWDMASVLRQIWVCFAHPFHWEWRKCITEAFSAIRKF